MTEAERALTREDFRNEIATARAVSGAGGVVPLLEEGAADRLDWYTMPYCTGGNFRPRVAASTTGDADDSAAALGILTDVAEGLHALHERGVVHRDVYQEKHPHPRGSRTDHRPRRRPPHRYPPRSRRPGVGRR